MSSYIYIYIWLFDRESRWSFMVLIVKRKGVTCHCEEGKERSLLWLGLYE